jgi:uncharacterized protein
MADYLLVEYLRGPAWDSSRRRREQAAWDEHAAFMDELVEDGVIVLGGPVGDVDGEKAILVCRATSEAELRRRLAADPWSETVLTVGSVEPWTIWLRGKGPI